MNGQTKNIYGVSSWYSTLADYTFPTSFVKLRESDLDLIVNEVKTGNDAQNIISRIKKAQHGFPGATFVFADVVTPTDTLRFVEKKGAVRSAKSAWNTLLASEKVKTAAKNREFEFICVRPFRNFTYPREFRLFIHDSKLKLMSQYLLDRPYQRLILRKEFWWAKAKELVEEISWLLPEKTIVLDVYFTSKDQILLIDFNKWGYPTTPLLANRWDINWDEELGIKLLQ